MTKLLSFLTAHTTAGWLLMLVVWCAGLFTIMLINALLFRFVATWSIDIFSWYREVLNNLAGAVGA